MLGRAGARALLGRHPGRSRAGAGTLLGWRTRLGLCRPEAQERGGGQNQEAGCHRIALCHPGQTRAPSGEFPAAELPPLAVVVGTLARDRGRLALGGVIEALRHLGGAPFEFGALRNADGVIAAGLARLRRAVAARKSQGEDGKRQTHQVSPCWSGAN